ncbi:MAG TPA: DNA/RNA-binding winged helix domain-containing protein, partial [Burkholderiaceae bacterium]|nr:DNA/RNA-binding winged helix domain-containing protein [Burkholderiaceae bacterium]
MGADYCNRQVRQRHCGLHLGELHRLWSIRDASARRTIGGGTVLDVMPQGSAARRGRRAPARLQLLAALRDGSPADALRAWLQRSPVPVARLASGWNLRDVEVQQLFDACGVHVASNIAVSAEHWQQLRGEVLTAVELAHQKEPEMPGVEQQRLRRMLAPAFDVEAFGSLIDELV